jgi:hypothetical protein
MPSRQRRSAGEGSVPTDLATLLQFPEARSAKVLSRESSSLELKESFNWASKDAYAKSCAAFANNRGGYIVFGVTNRPRRLVGLQSDGFENLDEARIAEYFNSVFSPELRFDKIVAEVRSHRVGAIHVYPAPLKPVVCIRNDGQALREADIYYRYNARSERIKFPELRALLEGVREVERRTWMAHLERISQIGAPNAAVLDVLTGRIEGQGGTLMIDRKLLPRIRFVKEGNFRERGWPTLRLVGDVVPAAVATAGEASREGPEQRVRITGDPDALAVRVEERNVRADYPLDYRMLTDGLRERYEDFKEDGKYHRIRKALVADSRYCNRRYLDSDNPRSPRKDYFSMRILQEFDRHYSPRKG